MTEIPVQLTVNGQHRSATVEARVTLADFLRERCRLTGTHLGCEHGVCGACTVLVDGAAVRSCLMFAVQADGADVTKASPHPTVICPQCRPRSATATGCSAASAPRASSSR